MITIKDNYYLNVYKNKWILDKSLVLDNNTWNYLIMNKQMINIK